MGPLHGVKVIEMAGLGATPFCTMMLADAGADVVTIGRPSAKPLVSIRGAGQDALGRGRRHLTLDLKKPQAIELVLRLLEGADVLVEGHRPGAMERLGLGPDVCLARNARLIYARMTGWGQYGPLAQAAGHDLNYTALSGALHAIGETGRPLPPLNMVGDYGGGGMMLAFGIASALFETRASGKGQVIDAAMSDGAALMMAPFYAMVASGSWKDERQSNVADGAAPYYAAYRCSDGNFISLAALEPQFYEQLLKLMELDDPVFRQRADQGQWPAIRKLLEERFATRSRDAWCALLEGTDVCFAPVLRIGEAHTHAHHRARGTFAEVAGTYQPAPAPRFSRTVAGLPPVPRSGAATADEMLLQAGLDAAAIEALRGSGALAA